MGGSSDSEYVTALATMTENMPSTSSPFTTVSNESALETENMPSTSSLPFTTVSSESMEERTEGGHRRNIAEQIENSRTHWSELVEPDSNSNEVAQVENVEEFNTLQERTPWGTFLYTFGESSGSWGELAVGEKFAEGGQAELYEAKVTWKNLRGNEYDLKVGRSWVLKVFKKGTFLRHLKSQWPDGMLQWHAERIGNARAAGTSARRPADTSERRPRYYCHVECGTLLEDGRFAFLMKKEDEDLRTLIDRNMTLGIGQGRGPFSKEDGELFMYKVARGMHWLHEQNIVHRDLKASNVLFTNNKKTWGCVVADFECSVGVVGTGFWRAPEILQACKDKAVSKKPQLFTKEADVYSYGMTCFEILTGELPFKGQPTNDYDQVLKGQRPEVPEYVDDWAHELLSRCWQSNPVDRPSFEEILVLLRTNSTTIREAEARL